MEVSWKNDPQKPLWRKRKTGIGVRLTPETRRIKDNERIRATREELGSDIEQFELIEEVNKQRYQSSKTDKWQDKQRFQVQPADVEGWYKIIDTLTNKPVTDKEYRKAEADKIAKNLNFKEHGNSMVDSTSDMEK